MNEEQIGQVFNTMLDAVQVAARQQPQQQLGVPAHAQQQPPRETPEQIQERYKQLLDPNSDSFNPEQAFAEFANKNYGGLIGDINRRSIMGMLSGYRATVPGWTEHERDVVNVLSNIPANQLNEGLVQQAYLQVVGYKALQKQHQEQGQRGTTTLAPTPAAPADQQTEPVKLSREEQAIAKVLYPNSENPEADYTRDLAFDGNLEMKVPLGKGKKG